MQTTGGVIILQAVYCTEMCITILQPLVSLLVGQTCLDFNYSSCWCSIYSDLCSSLLKLHIVTHMSFPRAKPNMVAALCFSQEERTFHCIKTDPDKINITWLCTKSSLTCATNRNLELPSLPPSLPTFFVHFQSTFLLSKVQLDKNRTQGQKGLKGDRSENVFINYLTLLLMQLLSSLLVLLQIIPYAESSLSNLSFRKLPPEDEGSALRLKELSRKSFKRWEERRWAVERGGGGASGLGLRARAPGPLRGYAHTVTWSR